MAGVGRKSWISGSASRNSTNPAALALVRACSTLGRELGYKKCLLIKALSHCLTCLTYFETNKRMQNSRLRHRHQLALSPFRWDRWDKPNEYGYCHDGHTRDSR
jgi:hypothetical protein